MNTPSIDHETAVAQLAELLNRRRLGAARDILGQTLPQFPDSPTLLQYAAWVDWMDDRLDDALATIEKILQIDPDSFDARFLLTRIFAEQERFAEAEQTVIGLLQTYPEEADLYAHYSRIMLQTFNTDKAERLASEALTRDPDNEDALNVHVLCGFINSSGSEQRTRLHELLRSHPDQTQSVIHVVQMLMDQGKTRAAYELARELVFLDPANEHLVAMAEELRRASHWSLIPLWPMQKWGWAASIGIWFAVVVLFNSGILDTTPLAEYKGELLAVVLIYVVYSWVWPPLLGRLLK